MISRTYQLMMDRFFKTNVSGRRRARRLLLSKTDRQLLDMGFSRELLEQGVKAWPWLSDTDSLQESARQAPVIQLHAHRTATIKEPLQTTAEQLRVA